MGIGDGEIIHLFKAHAGINFLDNHRGAVVQLQGLPNFQAAGGIPAFALDIERMFGRGFDGFAGVQRYRDELIPLFTLNHGHHGLVARGFGSLVIRQDFVTDFDLRNGLEAVFGVYQGVGSKAVTFAKPLFESFREFAR